MCFFAGLPWSLFFCGACQPQPLSVWGSSSSSQLSTSYLPLEWSESLATLRRHCLCVHSGIPNIFGQACTNRDPWNLKCDHSCIRKVPKQYSDYRTLPGFWLEGVLYDLVPLKSGHFFYYIPAFGLHTVLAWRVLVCGCYCVWEAVVAFTGCSLHSKCPSGLIQKIGSIVSVNGYEPFPWKGLSLFVSLAEALWNHNFNPRPSPPTLCSHWLQFLA